VWLLRGLRSFIHDCVEAGLSKFVIRPFTEVQSGEQEGEWLGDASDEAYERDLRCGGGGAVGDL
jgi:hypothetical protein